MDYIQANTCGRLHDAREASVSPLDRGFLYGDAIYEVWRTYSHCLFGFEEHWARLENTANGIGLVLPLDKATVISEIKKTVDAFRKKTNWAGDLYVRLQITRGAGAIGLFPKLADKANWVILVKPVIDFTEEELDAGMTISLIDYPRRNPVESLNPALKTGNYLNNILGIRIAEEKGTTEALFLNHQGEITETSVRNIGFVINGEVVTPPLESGILAGITRLILLRDIAPKLPFDVSERTLIPEDIARAQECFLISTTQDIQPVASIDETKFALGKNTVTREMKTAFAAYVKEYIAKNTQFLV